MTIDIKAIRASAAAAPQDSWRYEPTGQTVWAGSTYMVADIRGWGYLQYLPNGAEIQDATGVHIATANPATVIAMCDEIERLQKEVHNLNWALGTEGYTEMATPEEHAEHDAGMADVQAILDRMKAAKDAHEAMEKDAARYQLLKSKYTTENDNGELGIDFKCGFDHWNDIDAALDEELEPK